VHEKPELIDRGRKSLSLQIRSPQRSHAWAGILSMRTKLNGKDLHAIQYYECTQNYFWTIETEKSELTDAVEFLGAERFLATDYPHNDAGGRMSSRTRSFCRRTIESRKRTRSNLQRERKTALQAFAVSRNRRTGSRSSTRTNLIAERIRGWLVGLHTDALKLVSRPSGRRAMLLERPLINLEFEFGISPHVFSAATALILRKVDVLAHLHFDAERAIASALTVNPRFRVFLLSAHSNERLAQWSEWLKSERAACAGTNA